MCTLLGGLIGNGGLGCGFTVCVFLLDVFVVCVCVFCLVGLLVVAMGWERERLGERERGRIKNNKERMFKWRVKKKKNRSFDLRDIVKWCVICYKIGFWDAKC